MIQTPGAKGSKKVTNPFSDCHPLVFGRLRTMESPNSINGWDRSMAFARSAVTVREAAAMSAVWKKKSKKEVAYVNSTESLHSGHYRACSTALNVWINLIQKRKVTLICNKGIHVFDLFKLVTLVMFLSCLNTNQPMYAGWYFEFE